jgi:hypothetical protein
MWTQGVDESHECAVATIIAQASAIYISKNMRPLLGPKLKLSDPML